MRKAVIAVLVIVMGIFVMCSCDTYEKVYEQTGNLGYELDIEWESKTVTPAPSTVKTYTYNDYKVMVGSVSYYFYEDPLREAIDYVIGESFGQGISYEGPSDCTAGELKAKEAVINSEAAAGIFTAIETESGVYVIATVTDNPERAAAINDKHSALKETVVYSDAGAGEVYADNLLQFTDYICKAPGWDAYLMGSSGWVSRVCENNGVIDYIFGDESESLKIIPMDAPELTEETVHETLGYIYNGEIAPEAMVTLSEGTQMESSLGSAVYYELDLHFGEDKSNTVKASAVFITDKDGHAVCCFCNTADSDLNFDYQPMITSMQLAAPVYEQVDMIYSLSAEFTGDNSAVINLMSAIGFDKYGDYTIELKTSETPYGMKVLYSNDVTANQTSDADQTPYDFQREAVMMLGLVDNLEYIEIKDADSNIVRYDTSVTKTLLMYDVKDMAEDKSKLESYYLETLY